MNTNCAITELSACEEPTICLFPRGDGGARSDLGVVLEELAGAGRRNTSVQTGERGGLCLAASVDFFVCPHTSSQDIAVFPFSRRRCLGFLKLLTDKHSVFLPSVLWHCWLGVRKSIQSGKNWVMRCWCGYLPVARCRLFAYGPADATASQNPIISCLI